MSDHRASLIDLLDELDDLVTSGYHRDRPPRTLPDVSPPSEVMPGVVSGESRTLASADAESAGDSIETIAAEVSRCELCPLAETRTNTVPGTGSLNPEVLIIGEGPGADEDRTGLPFVGAAGKYLDKWLAAIELSRETNCFIANVVKCRPPRNRDPHPKEIDSCISFLERQVEILKPKVILTLGRIATQVLTGSPQGIGAQRGKIHAYREVPLIATYHPSAVLRDSGYRSAVWDDLRALRELLDKQ